MQRAFMSMAEHGSASAANSTANWLLILMALTLFLIGVAMMGPSLSYYWRCALRLKRQCPKSE